MVKTILKEERVTIPEGVEASIKSKIVSIKGKLGELSRSFQKVPVQFVPELDDKKRVSAIAVRIWFAKSKPKSCVTSICRHIKNMIIGVTKGFTYVMKYGYKIFPLQPLAIDNGSTLQVTNYLGEKYIRKVKAVRGTKIITTDQDQKREVKVTGIDREAIGLTCALIHQSCVAHNKDKRMFKDGLYLLHRNVSEE